MSDYERTVEVTPAARTAISQAIKDRYDGRGRELGGALVGHTYDDRVVVTDANGLGSVGVETPRGDTWFRPSRARWYEFAQACGAELLGDCSGCCGRCGPKNHTWFETGPGSWGGASAPPVSSKRLASAS